jgi:hypothetical protein
MRRSQKIPLVVSVVVAGLVVAGVLAGLVAAPQGAAQGQGPLLEYPPSEPTATIGPNPQAGGPGLAGATVVLAQSSFDDASALASWEPVDLGFVLADSRSGWTVAEGRLAQDYAGLAKDASIQETAALSGSTSWTDYTVEVSFYDQFNGTAGLMARYSGADPTTASYYRVRMLKDTFEASPKLVLEKVVQGAPQSLVEIKGPGFSERVWHRLSLTVQGGALTAKLDGVVVAEATDSAPLAAGRAGIYTRAVGGIVFDDFLVTAP